MDLQKNYLVKFEIFLMQPRCAVQKKQSSARGESWHSTGVAVYTRETSLWRSYSHIKRHYICVHLFVVESTVFLILHICIAN